MFKPSLWRRQHGFTLIEIMVSMVLVGILVVGLSGVWTMVGEQFFRITLRQKAVFVLHGQMERIAMMYRTGTDNMEMSSVTSGYDATTHPNTNTYYVFADSAPLDDIDSDILIATQDEFELESVDEDVPDPGLGAIYYMDIAPLGISSEDRNVVWLDKDKNVTAIMSWTLSDTDIDVDNPVAGDDCYDGATATCQLLTLYLDYPYRYSDGGLTEMLGTAKTIILKTIVGRYQ